jgi:hypothetical protein
MPLRRLKARVTLFVPMTIKQKQYHNINNLKMKSHEGDTHKMKLHKDDAHKTKSHEGDANRQNTQRRQNEIT